MVYIFLGEGFEEIEAISPCDILRRGGVDVKYVGIDSITVTGAHGIRVEADIALDDVNLDDAEMLVIPGGGGGVESIKKSQKTLDLISEGFKRGIKISAICAGPTVLAKLNIADGCDAVCYPGTEAEMGNANIIEGVNVVKSGKIITGRAPGAAMDFGLALLDDLKGKATAAQVKSDLCYNG